MNLNHLISRSEFLFFLKSIRISNESLFVLQFSSFFPQKNSIENTMTLFPLFSIVPKNIL